MKRIALAVFLLALAAAGTASAQAQQSDTAVKPGFRTGEEFMAACPADEPADNPTLNGALCIAYMRGYQDAMIMSEKVLRTILGNDFRWTVCISENLSPSMAIKTVRTWLERHPENLKQSLAGIVTAALHDNFPCSQG